MMCLMIIFWTWSCGCPWSPCLPNVFGAIQTMAAFFVWTNMIHSIVSIMFTNNWQNDPNSSHVTVGIFHDNVWWWWWCAKCFTNLPNDSYNLCNNWQNDPNSSPQWQLASSLVHSRGVAARTERAAPAYYSLAFLDPDWDPRSWIMDPGIWILDTGLKFSIQDLRKWEGGAAALLSWSSAKLPHLWIKLLISGGFWTFVKALVRKGVLPAESFCLEHCLCNERWALMLPQSWTGEEERWEWFYLSNQGGRSCTGPWAAPAKKFGLGRKF